MILLYHIKNKVTGKCYIGQTKQQLAHRWLEHQSGYSCCRYLRDAIGKYGAENFEIMPLCYADSRKHSNALEKWLIKLWGTLVPSGYNLCAGGNVSDDRHPESTTRMQKSLTGKKKKSPESIAKRTATRKANKERISASLIAAWSRKSDEDKAVHLGRIHTTEAHAKAAKARTGAKKSSKEVERIRQMRLAEWRDPEMCARRLVGLVKARERRKAA